MTYLSVCSGIEAATVAWHPLGWEPVGFAEIDPFPSAVLAHHYPNVKNYGDFTCIDSIAPDLLVGGTPCQAFSVAGKRAGLDDPRGNLTLEWRSDKIYDLTLTQFNRDADPVSILPANDNRYDPLSPLADDEAREHLAVIGMEAHMRPMLLRVFRLMQGVVMAESDGGAQ